MALQDGLVAAHTTPRTETIAAQQRQVGDTDGAVVRCRRHLGARAVRTLRHLTHFCYVGFVKVLLDVVVPAQQMVHRQGATLVAGQQEGLPAAHAEREDLITVRRNPLWCIGQLHPLDRLLKPPQLYVTPQALDIDHVPLPGPHTVVQRHHTPSTMCLSALPTLPLLVVVVRVRPRCANPAGRHGTAPFLPLLDLLHIVLLLALLLFVVLHLLQTVAAAQVDPDGTRRSPRRITGLLATDGWRCSS
mmetsp:Transcript_13308/g.38382  ORF Transcript_13308/g.38382 Transcript_13308/m.38382 type:complete len:246 (+) Transcript_13308:1535-2272(+)